MFSKKATKIDEIFTIYLTLCSSKCQIKGEDFVNFCGLLRKHELYWVMYFILVRPGISLVAMSVFDIGLKLGLVYVIEYIWYFFLKVNCVVCL